MAEEMRPPVLDPAVGSENCWQGLEGGYTAEFSLHAGAPYLKQGWCCRAWHRERKMMVPAWAGGGSPDPRALLDT